MSETDKPNPDPAQPPGAEPPHHPGAAPTQHPGATQPLGAEGSPAQPGTAQPSGAEAPTQPGQPAAPPPPPAQVAQAPPAQPAPRRPPRLMRTWLAATIGAVILVAAGLGGYFIGAATHDHDNRPGATRFDHRPYGPGPHNAPRFRDGTPG